MDDTRIDSFAGFFRAIAVELGSGDRNHADLALMDTMERVAAAAERVEARMREAREQGEAKTIDADLIEDDTKKPDPATQEFPKNRRM